MGARHVFAAHAPTAANVLDVLQWRLLERSGSGGAHREGGCQGGILGAGNTAGHSSSGGKETSFVDTLARYRY